MPAKIRIRNCLCWKIHQNQQKWVHACHEATDAINGTKTENWKDLLHDAILNKDGPNMQKVIQALNSSSNANSPNEAMSQHSSIFSKITWSFGSPGTTIHIQFIFSFYLLLENLKRCHYHSITESWGSPSEVESFCPISLTSCVVKLLERNLGDRLYYIETKNIFSQFQADFHMGWSCEDQIVWIVQAIEHRLQQRSVLGSVLTLLDFNKAYKMVWRERLLIFMLYAGIPYTFIWWLHSFCNDSRPRLGLPQGSILAPLLFLFYINNLAFSLTNDAVVATFADDVSIFTKASKREDTKAASQPVVNRIFARSQQEKLNLNADKSEIYPFSNLPINSTGHPALFISND